MNTPQQPQADMNAMLTSIANLSAKNTELERHIDNLYKQMGDLNSKNYALQIDYNKEHSNKMLALSGLNSLNNLLYSCINKDVSLRKLIEILHTQLINTSYIIDATICFCERVPHFTDDTLVSKYLDSVYPEVFTPDLSILDVMHNSKFCGLRRNYDSVKDNEYVFLYATKIEPVLAVFVELEPSASDNSIEALNAMLYAMGQVIFLERSFLNVNRHYKEQNSLIKTRLDIDAVTGIASKDALADALNKMFIDKYIICFIDIDNFKSVNDTYGHDNGDAVLKWFAKNTDTICSDNSGYVYRLAGDEFIILFNNTQLDYACEVIMEVMSTFKKKIFKFSEDASEQPGDYEWSTTCSAGIYVCNKPEPFEVTKKHADTAMYSAKKSKKGTLHILNEVQAEDGTLIYEAIQYTGKRK